jgi:hypothetical protein
MDDDVLRFMREIRRRKIVQPDDGEHVGPCHFSKTGWAVWTKNRACSCKPARKPRDEDAATDAFVAWSNEPTGA